MSQLLDPNWNRATFLPYARNKQTGEGSWAVPGIVADLLSAVMLPGDVYQGNVLLRDPQSGQINDEVIRRSADLAGAMTLGAGAIPAEANSLRMGIKAYHGSPHDFDRFSMDKIGTGEGAQAYGHGLYFAENEGVADSYARSLGAFHQGAGQAPDLARSMLKSFGGDYERAAKMLRAQIAQSGEDISPAELQELKATLYLLENKKDAFGHRYEVNINANPEDFLDWDKPLSEQPTALKAVERLFESGALDGKDKKASQAWADPSFREHLKTMTGERARDMIAAYRTGGQVYSGYFPTVKGGSKAQADAANLLRSENIPGIKYLDAGSRGAGDGSRNYVVFDDKLISIVRKYGLAGAVAAGVITQQQAEQMQQQGLI